MRDTVTNGDCDSSVRPLTHSRIAAITESSSPCIIPHTDPPRRTTTMLHFGSDFFLTRAHTRLPLPLPHLMLLLASRARARRACGGMGEGGVDAEVVGKDGGCTY